VVAKEARYSVTANPEINPLGTICRLPLDSDVTQILPHRDKDAVLSLYAHYFLACELMLNNYKRLITKRNQRSRLNQNDDVQLSIYFCTWLGLLGVTAEGFKKLGIRRLVKDARPSDFVELIPKADELGKLLKKHDGALRKFRNNFFHLLESVEEIERLFYEQPNRLEWAEELQAAFNRFFSSYRILCQVHYVIENRKEEMFKLPPTKSQPMVQGIDILRNPDEDAQSGTQHF